MGPVKLLPQWLIRLGNAVGGSVRLKLMAMVMAPLLLGMPLLLIIVWIWGTQGYDRLMLNKVSSDLGTARQYFDRVQNGVSTGLDGFAGSHRLFTALHGSSPSQLASLIDSEARDQGLDYLLLVDTQGRVLAGDGHRGEDRRHWKVVSEALSGHSLRGLSVFSRQDLANLNPHLPDQAHLELVPTRNAAPDGRFSEDRGLLIQAAVPVFGPDHQVVGALEGGVLLNGNLGIVDRINTIVYQEASLPLGSQGTATLFLGDTRIATNVRIFESQRALGTRVSAQVRARVLDQGEVWLGSAFVVNDRYISGYEPLTDTEGRRVGMLYVGFLEAPLQHALYMALAALCVLFLLFSGLGTLVALRSAQTIFRPLERMNKVMERIGAGDESARIGPTTSRDELGRLARTFDELLNALVARRFELQSLARSLDRKVAERTAELEKANATLLRAQEQLEMNEKLTAIGELTAGVAHEINNPVAVIQGNLDLLHDVLGDAAAPVEEEIRLIDEQISRIRLIITKLLQFARPGDFAGYAEATDLNDVVTDCLVLTRHNLNRASVKVETRLAARQWVEVNRAELQQVLINLIVNALQAMAEGGSLLLETADIDDDGVPGALVRVRDTGPGIAAGVLGRIFDPFFTTKKQEGTGLGLSISYAIVKRYGGSIEVESRPGEGATFTVRLHEHARYSEEPTAPGFTARLFRPNET
jgi:two-component system NtrC family sensor kinase